MTKVELLSQLGELRVREVLQRRDWTLVADRAFTAEFKEWGIADDRLVAAEQLEQVLSAGHRIKFAIICTEAQEAPLQKMLREHGVQSAGLFNQLILRLSAQVAPRFDAREKAVIDKAYAIICLPRCGSTLLTKELSLVGGGEPNEHFKASTQKLLRGRNLIGFNLRRWWEMVRAGHTINGVFGTKIIYYIWRMVEPLMNDAERDEITDFLKNNKIVYLEREDKFGQAVSDVIARRTGVWHLWSKDHKENHERLGEEMLSSYLQEDERAQADLQEAIRTLKKFRASERALLEFLDDLGADVINVSYTKLVADMKGEVSRVATALGLTVSDDYLAQPPSLEPTTTPAHEALRQRLIVAASN